MLPQILQTVSAMAAMFVKSAGVFFMSKLIRFSL